MVDVCWPPSAPGRVGGPRSLFGCDCQQACPHGHALVKLLTPHRSGRRCIFQCESALDLLRGVIRVSDNECSLFLFPFFEIKLRRTLKIFGKHWFVHNSFIEAIKNSRLGKK